MKKLVLFDIDGTMILGTGKDPETFGEVFNETLNTDTVENEGETDLAIMNNVLKKHNESEDKEKITKLIVETSKKSKTKDISDSKILRGVKDLLEKLREDEGITPGLITGNLKEIAKHKLEYFKLKNYFKLGSSGDKAETRKELILNTMKEAQDAGINISIENMIMADTSKDIQGAKQAGITSIAVCAGEKNMETLKKERSDYIFQDLKDTNKMMQVILK